MKMEFDNSLNVITSLLTAVGIYPHSAFSFPPALKLRRASEEEGEYEKGHIIGSFT
jgi:hypothetical protein